VADSLVRRGVPFRAAHHVVGRLVAAAEAARWRLDEVRDADVRTALEASDDPTARGLAVDPGIAAAVRAAAALDAALAAPDVIGGTAPGRVQEALRAARARLGPSAPA
jgi:argininosuccinate lyase